MSSKTDTKRIHCFLEEDDGLASITETQNNCPLTKTPICYNGFSRRRISDLLTVSSPRKITSGRFFIEDQNQPHFLDSCFLCNKPLADRDIFMYRGDTPFCSEDCREEQIDMDEAKEWNLKSIKTLRNKEQRNSSKSQNKTEGKYWVRTSTVVAV